MYVDEIVGFYLGGELALIHDSIFRKMMKKKKEEKWENLEKFGKILSVLLNNMLCYVIMILHLIYLVLHTS